MRSSMNLSKLESLYVQWDLIETVRKLVNNDRARSLYTMARVSLHDELIRLKSWKQELFMDGLFEFETNYPGLAQVLCAHIETVGRTLRKAETAISDANESTLNECVQALNAEIDQLILDSEPAIVAIELANKTGPSGTLVESISRGTIVQEGSTCPETSSTTKITLPTAASNDTYNSTQGVTQSVEDATENNFEDTPEIIGVSERTQVDTAAKKAWFERRRHSIAQMPGLIFNRMRVGKQKESKPGEGHGDNPENQSCSNEGGFFVRREDKFKGGGSSESHDIMGNHIPTASHPQRYSSVPTVSGMHAPYQGPSSWSSPWSSLPSQDSTSMSSQILYGSAYGSRPSQNQMRHSSEPARQGGGQPAGGHWVPAHQTQIYEEPGPKNNTSGYMQPTPENPFAQEDPRSMNVGLYHAQQGAGLGHYSLQPGRDSYSGAPYQPGFCYHNLPYHHCSQCSGYRNPNPY